MNKKIYTFGLLLFLSFTGIQAQTIVDQGTCGDSLTWVLTSDSTLTISGNGAMDDYVVGTPPWYSSYQRMIKTVVIDSGVTGIGDYAFRDCWSLTSVIIPNSVITIGNHAFYFCKSLVSINIPNSVTTIGNYAFWCTALTFVSIPNSVTTIGSYAFYGCDFISIAIPISVTDIGVGAFVECSNLLSINVDTNNLRYSSIDGVLYSKLHDTLIQYPRRKTGIIIPNTVTTIGDYAFAYCLSYSIIIPNSVTTIGSYAFKSSHFASIIIPNSVTTIGNYAFYNCVSYSITISNSITTIREGTFVGCMYLTSIIIPHTVTTIGDSAFYFCLNLNSIVCEAVIPPVVNEHTFLYVSTAIPVYVPCNSFESYKTADYWSVFTNFQGMNDTVFIFDTICQGAVYNDNGFTINNGAGIYYRIQTTVNYCYSVICLTLSEYPFVSITHYSATVCQGNIYNDDNFTNLTRAGDYYDTLKNVHGCDSVIYLTLSTYPPIPIIHYSATICQGKAYSDSNFTNLTQTGWYSGILQNVNGCDSVVYLHLEVIIVLVPVDLTVTQVDNYFSITWQGNAESYKLYRNNTLLVTLDTTTSYLDTNLIEGTSYCYTINAIEEDCESELSEEVCLTFNHTGIAERQTTKFNVYPNPTNGQLIISYAALTGEDEQLNIEHIEIFDVMGKNVYSRTCPSIHSSTIMIDVSHLPSGIYLLKITTEHGIIIQKEIKN